MWKVSYFEKISLSVLLSLCYLVTQETVLITIPTYCIRDYDVIESCSASIIIKFVGFTLDLQINI